MPNYDYFCPVCKSSTERMTDIDNRDLQQCDICANPLTRKFTFKGSVWSPTKNGGMS